MKKKQLVKTKKPQALRIIQDFKLFLPLK